MKKDKLRLDVSWLWFVVRLCFTCRIMSNRCLMYPSNYLMCKTCVRFVSNLVTWGICYLSPVFSYSALAYISRIVNFITWLLCNIIFRLTSPASFLYWSTQRNILLTLIIHCQLDRGVQQKSNDSAACQKMLQFGVG